VGEGEEAGEESRQLDGGTLGLPYCVKSPLAAAPRHHLGSRELAAWDGRTFYPPTLKHR
jgi:hypothetical protein